MMNLLPRHFASTLAGLVLLGMLLMLTACDDDTVAPRVTVPEIDQPEPGEVQLEVPIDGSSATSEEITVEYRGLDEAPDIDAEIVEGDAGAVSIVNRSDSGSPFEGGSTTFSVEVELEDNFTVADVEADVSIQGTNAELSRSASASVGISATKIAPSLTTAPASLNLEIPEGGGVSDPDTVVVSYVGLDARPAFNFDVLTADPVGTFELVDEIEEGTAAEGSTSFVFTYESDNEEEDTEAVLSLSGTNSEFPEPFDELSAEVAVTGSGGLEGVVGQEGVLTRFLNVADYEERSIDENGASAEVVGDAAQEASGVNSLEISGGSGSGVTLSRTAVLGDANFFAFYGKGDSNQNVDLIWTFTDDTGSSSEFVQSLRAGSDWLYYEIPAAEAGLDELSGTIASITIDIDGIPPGAEVSVNIDELIFGADDQVRFSFFDFDNTTNNYKFGSFSRTFTDAVAPESSGFRAREKTGNDDEGGTGFGFNYDFLRLPEADLDNDVLQLRIGNVSDDFTLFIFLETRGFIGGFNFDNGIEVNVSASSDWTVLEWPLSDFGDDPNTLIETNGDGGISNVGFEIRNASDDVTFLMDDIVIRRGN